MQPVRVHARKSRPLGVREVQTIEYRLYRTIEPKQRGAGASVSSDARRVCDASGQEKGTPERMRPGRKGWTYEIGIANRPYSFVGNFSTFPKNDNFPKSIARPLPPRYAALRGPLPSPEGTAFWGFTAPAGLYPSACQISRTVGDACPYGTYPNACQNLRDGFGEFIVPASLCPGASPMAHSGKTVGSNSRKAYKIVDRREGADIY